MKINVLILAATMIFSLTACGSNAKPSASAPEESNPPAQPEVVTSTTPERNIAYSMLLDGKGKMVYLDVSDEEITLIEHAILDLLFDKVNKSVSF